MEEDLIHWHGLIMRPDNKKFEADVAEYVEGLHSRDNLRSKIDNWLESFLKMNTPLGKMESFPGLDSDLVQDEEGQALNDYNKVLRSLGLVHKMDGPIKEEGLKRFLIERMVHLTVPNEKTFRLLAKVSSCLHIQSQYRMALADSIQKGIKEKRDQWVRFLIAGLGQLPDSILSFYRDEESVLQSLHLSVRRTYADFDDIKMAERNHLRIKDDALFDILLLADLNIDDFIDILIKCRYDEVRSILLLFMDFSSKLELITKVRDRSLQLKEKNVEAEKVLYHTILSAIDYVKKIEHSVSWCAEWGGEYSRKDLWERSKNVLVELRKAKLPKVFEDFFDPIYKADKDQTLLTNLLIYLTHQRLYIGQASSSKKEWDAETVAYESIIKILRNNNYKPSQLIISAREALKDSRQRARYHPENLLLASIDLEFTKEKVDCRSIWEWYADLLKNRSLELSSHVSHSFPVASWVFQDLGVMIVSVPDTMKRLTMLWDSLYEQRFFFRFHPSEKSYIEPSKHLLKSIRSSLAVLITNPNYSDASAQELWKFSTQYEYYIEPLEDKYSYINDQSSLIEAFCYLPHVFKDNWAHPLGEYINLLKHDPTTLVLMAHALINNGLKNEEISSCFKENGVDLKKTFEATWEWHQALGYPDKFMPALEKVKQTLQV